MRGITPPEFMNRIGAQVMSGALPLGDRFFEISYDYWGEPHYGDVQFIGVTTVAGDGGDWALAFEANGHAGVTTELVTPVSAGTRLVSHRYNGGNGVGSFCWIEDGDVRLAFEPLFAFSREGSAPHAVLEDMKQIGFSLDQDGDDIGPTTSAAFALGERLTGVRVTTAMLDEAVFLCGTVQLPA